MIAIVQFRSCKKKLTQYNSSPSLIEIGASKIELTRVICSLAALIINLARTVSHIAT